MDALPTTRAASKDPVRRVPPYKDFLQPALHRRFSSTALVLLGMAYAESLVLSSPSSWLWVWLPLSSAGLRACVFFFCGLIILVLRIAQLHIGLRTARSPIEAFLRHAATMQTAETLVSYGLAAWLFAQAFRWSFPESENLGWISHYPGDRTRLNERSVFLVVHVVVCGVLHALLHLVNDIDHLLLGSVRANSTAPSTTARPLQTGLIARLPRLLFSSFTRAAVALAISMPTYALVLRRTAWRLALAVFRPFYSLPRSTLPPLALPFTSSWGFLPRCLEAAFLFSLLLGVSNAAFSLLLATEPRKDGKPLTAGSRDPNGSLLNGLHSRKARIQAFALWELALIARDEPTRRVALYMDIDRKDGAAWTQICRVCLEVLASLEARIDADVAGADAGAKSIDTEADEPPAPRRLTKPLPDQTVVAAVAPGKKTLQHEVEKVVMRVAVRPDQSPRLSPVAKKALQTARRRIRDVQRDMQGAGRTGSGLQAAVLKGLSVPILGLPFRMTFGQRLAAAVLGGPYGEPSRYANAVSALSLLAVHSLEEDRFGHVQRDVATIVRTLTRISRKLQAFRAEFAVYWTDVETRSTCVAVCPVVDDIVGAFSDGLTGLLATFEPYSRELRLTAADMRLARLVVENRWRSSMAAPEPVTPETPEMEERR